MDLTPFININHSRKSPQEFKNFLQNFEFKEGNSKPSKTQMFEERIGETHLLKFVNEFWTAKQRQAAKIHEISYRACFKAQLPAFFIERLTEQEDVVYDPFSGRGTTIIEAVLRTRIGVANDINPLSKVLAQPRLCPPKIKEIENRLGQIPLDKTKKADLDLSMFYHADTEGEIVSLRDYLKKRNENGEEDDIDRWIRMVATNRLTGHSTGFFSVYTLPPNQAVSQASQIKINEKRNQKPEYKDVKKIILKKSNRLLKKTTSEQFNNLKVYGKKTIFLIEDARDTKEINSNSVQLTVTSPPFLDIVQYSKDNWLRCWFNSLDDKEIGGKITMSRTVEDWSAVMGDVFKELFRITKPGGWVAFEVGEVRNGKIKLDEHVVPLGISAGFNCFGILINSQTFTKTSNIWGVNNGAGGTNTNRIVIFNKTSECFIQQKLL